MADCNCPFCPLEEANLQICNVIVSLGRSKWRVIGLPKEYKHLERDIIMIVLFHRNNLQLAVGDSHTGEVETHKRTVERLSQTRFKVCFHTKEPGVP